MKVLDQKRLDDARKSYKLAFPADLDPERVTAWLRSISGTLRAGHFILGGVPTICFELWATNQGMTHRLKVPWQHADYVVTQLRSLIPGVRVVPEDEFQHRDWTHAVEVGLTHSSRQLRIYSAADVAASLLASAQALNADETLLVQWVTTPTAPTHPPIHNEAQSHHLTLKTLINGNLATRDEVNDRRGKLDEPNMLAVLRVAAYANTTVRAEHLVYRVRHALASVRSPSTRFYKRFVTNADLQRRVDQASASHVFPMQLSVSELAALIAWPLGNPFVAGLPPRMSRHIPANETIPRTGRIIGRSNFPGNERPIAVAYQEALMHMHIAGPTGSGKTALLANMLKQDVEQGYGVVLIESKGDLFHAALKYIPPNRVNDVIILDVNDTTRPVGFNILNQGDSRVVIDEIANLFESLYDTNSVWQKEVLYHGLRTLATDARMTFVDLGPLLVPMTQEEMNWRDSLVRNLKDTELRNFWQRFENQPRAAQDRITQPVMDRIWQLNARPELRNVIGQSMSGFQMTDVIEGNKILLVNLSGLGRDTASLTGTLIMNALWHAVKTTRGRRPNYLYLDEFQDYLKLPVDPEDMLAKARGFGLGMTLAHQHLGQLPTDMRQAVMANARTKVIFQTSSADAQAMAREFGSHHVDDSDFMHLGSYEAIARVATSNGGVSTPITLVTNEPAKGYGLAQQVRQVSRQTHGRPAAEVQAEIVARRTTAVPTKRRRPKLGGDAAWG